VAVSPPSDSTCCSPPCCSVVPNATLAEKRIIAIAVRPRTFPPSANNWDDVNIILRTKDSTHSNIRLWFDYSLKIFRVAPLLSVRLVAKEIDISHKSVPLTLQVPAGIYCSSQTSLVGLSWRLFPFVGNRIEEKYVLSSILAIDLAHTFF
jgi:hypothetical protein